MGNRILLANSNPWVKPDLISFFGLDDFNPSFSEQYQKLIKGEGALSPTSNDSLRIALVLRRALPEHFGGALEQSKQEIVYTSEQLLDLPYQELVRYTQSLTPDDRASLYGASDRDLHAVRQFVRAAGGVIAADGTDQEKRQVVFDIPIKNFFKHFTDGNLNIASADLSYIHSDGFNHSFLSVDGDGAEAFAEALIGVEILAESASSGSNAAGEQLVPNSPPTVFYPTEVGEAYQFDDPAPIKSDEHRPVIGLVGTGGNQFMLSVQKSDAYRQFLSNQGIDPGRVPAYQSLAQNEPNGSDVGEQALDLSVLSSIAPDAQIIASGQNSGRYYDSLASLIFNKDYRIDVISSSSADPVLFAYQNPAFDELFVDALLRGIPVVVAAGDQGTANLENGGSVVWPSGDPYPLVGTGLSGALSVGGTSFSPALNLAPFTDAFDSDRDRVHSGDAGFAELNGDSVLDQATWKTIGTLPDNFYFLKLRDDNGQNALDGLLNYINNLRVENNVGSPLRFSDYYGEGEDYVVSDFANRDLVLVSNGINDEGRGGFLAANSIGSSGFWSDASPVLAAGYQDRSLPAEWSEGRRRFPDVSVLAGGNTLKGSSNSYGIVGDVKGVFDFKGGVTGTSAGAPLIAGLLANAAAELKQKFGADTQLGFVNPLLYELYQSDARDELFFDVPAGSNNANVFEIAKTPEEWTGNYLSWVIDEQQERITFLPLNGTLPNGMLDTSLSNTGVGFDAATGLGSLHGGNLIEQILEAHANL